MSFHIIYFNQQKNNKISNMESSKLEEDNMVIRKKSFTEIGNLIQESPLNKENNLNQTTEKDGRIETSL